MTTAQWRGRLDDDAGDDAGTDPEAVDSANGAAKARALLGSLLRPYRYTVAFLAVVVVVENAARPSILARAGLADTPSRPPARA